MREREILRQLKNLRKIKPNQDWVSFTKREILGEDIPSFRFSFKPALGIISLALLVMLSSSFVFAQYSLPGDTLYPLKKITERAKLALAPQEKKPVLQLELTKERLKELKTIAKENKIEKLNTALSEVNQTIPEATKTIKIISQKKDGRIKDVKEIVKKVDEIEKAKKEIQSLGIKIGADEELEKSAKELRKELAEREIKDLEEKSLNENQKKLFQKAKGYFQKEDYSKCLETIFYLTNQ